MLALSLALVLAPASDPKDTPNPRQVAESYLAAALAGKPDDAVKFAEAEKSPAKPENVTKLKERIALDKLALETVIVSEKKGYALAVSAKLKFPKVGGDARLLFTLKQVKGAWVVKDIDVRESAEGEKRIADAKALYEDAKELPAKK